MHLWCKIWKSQVTVRNVDLRVFWGRPWGVFTPQTGLKAIQFYLKWFSTVGTCEKWSFPAFITSLEPRRIKDGIGFLLHKHEMLDCLYIGYSSKVTLRIFTLSELQVLNEKGYKAVENRIQWAAICRILVCGSWGQTNGDGAAERKQAERHVPGGIRGFLITEKRCESHRRVCVIQTWPQQQTSQTGKAEVLFIPTKERFTCAKGHPFILRDFTSPWCCVRFPPARVDFSFLILEL